MGSLGKLGFGWVCAKVHKLLKLRGVVLVFKVCEGLVVVVREGCTTLDEIY